MSKLSVLVESDEFRNVKLSAKLRKSNRNCAAVHCSNTYSNRPDSSFFFVFNVGRCSAEATEPSFGSPNIR